MPIVPLKNEEYYISILLITDIVQKESYMLKHILIILSLILASASFAGHQHEDLTADQWKAKIAEKADKKIELINKLKTCVSDAADKDAIMACKKDHKASMKELKGDRHCKGDCKGGDCKKCSKGGCEKCDKGECDKCEKCKGDDCKKCKFKHKKCKFKGRE